MVKHGYPRLAMDGKPWIALVNHGYHRYPWFRDTQGGIRRRALSDAVRRIFKESGDV